MEIEELRKKPGLAKPLLLVTVVLCGAATMALEFGASRLLGNVFGTSNLVWAVVIGLILVYLSLGYWLGGRLADRQPKAALLYRLIGLAGAFTALVPLISRPVLRLSANAFDALDLPVLGGSFLAVLLFFTLPVTLLGMVVPFSLRLAIPDAGHAGRTSGLLSAFSTAGSFAGSFLMVLVALPLLGTYRSLLLISFVLLGLSATASFLMKHKQQRAIFLIGLFIVLGLFWAGPAGTTKETSGQIYEKESAYNYIQVLEADGYRYLRLNEGQGIHSVWHPTEHFYGGPWSQFLTAPLVNSGTEALPPIRQIAILGLAAGTSARQAGLVYPEAQVDGFEIDPEILKVGEAYFGLGELKNLNTMAEDARWGIQHSQKAYDLIIVDAYRPPYIPPHLVTLEFFQALDAKMGQQGIVSINVGRSPNDNRLVESLAATMHQVFPQIFAIELPDAYNTILIAAKDPLAAWDNFEAQAERLEREAPETLLAKASRLAIAGNVPVALDGTIFTDDKAPIEWMTNRLVLNFLLEEKP